jgi:hypothetical protein
MQLLIVEVVLDGVVIGIGAQNSAISDVEHLFVQLNIRRHPGICRCLVPVIQCKKAQLTEGKRTSPTGCRRDKRMLQKQDGSILWVRKFEACTCAIVQHVLAPQDRGGTKECSEGRIG